MLYSTQSSVLFRSSDFVLSSDLVLSSDFAPSSGSAVPVLHISVPMPFFQRYTAFFSAVFSRNDSMLPA